MNKVQVLISTYNGEKYLEEQIQSILNQTGVKVGILVRDDCSKDGTVEILEKYRKKGLLDYYIGENLKPAKSFLNLIKKASAADYYAFCDQDDYWLPNKLIEATKFLDRENNVPALYFSKASLVDKGLNEIRYNNYPTNKYTFGQALIKNNATGCTMVFNKELLKVVNTYEPNFITMHDYWIYLVCLAINGKVYYDTNSYIKYRQHENNVVGGKNDVLKKYIRKAKMLFYKDKYRYRIAKELKNGYYNLMDKTNKKLINRVICYPNSFRDKLALLQDKKIVASNLKDNIFFSIAVIFNAF